MPSFAACQQPLKDRYREDPDAALVTLSATSTLADGITCSVRTGKAIAAAGLHPASGGDGSTLCSGDMLLEALAACAGVTLRAVATSLEIEITQGFVHADGELDFRGTLGVDRDVPVGFQSIELRFDLRDRRLGRAARHPPRAHPALLRRPSDALVGSPALGLVEPGGRLTRTSSRDFCRRQP